MTKSRLEIELEGSRDGIEWRPYRFKFKPDGRGLMPPTVAPHQPRLDWQMWFAALGGYEQSPWFARLQARLLEGSPDVLALFDGNPFPDLPPQFIRARTDIVDFASPHEIFSGKGWWHRRPAGVFGPTLSRTD